jgi:hypothetical protein
MRRSSNFIRNCALAAAGLVMTFASAGWRGNTAHADQWTLHASPYEVWCEGCCGSTLCCSINAPCRHALPAEPGGGG